METLQRTANRGSLSTGFDIDNSVVFETANSERLSRDNTNTGQRRTFSISAWIKRTKLGYNRTIGVGVSGNDQQIIIFNASDQLVWYDYHGGAYSFNYITNRVFRDTSAWYHFLFAVDTEQGTESNRVRLYINGVEETSFATQTEPSQNRDTNWNYANGVKEFGNILNEAPFASCYMSEVAFVDDAQLAPTDVGEFDEDTGIWKPIDISGLTFGTSGSYCEFKNASALGEDSSSNGNDFTATNITSADQATDTPTNNFSIPNVIGTTRTNKFTYTEGGTKVVSAGSTDWDSWANTIAVGNGKWYAEFKIINTGNYFVGVGSEEYYFVGAGNGTGWPEIYYGYSGTNSVGFYNSNGDIYNNGTQVVIGTTYTANDIISVALDMDNGKVYFAKNGTYIDSQNPVTGTNAQNLPDTEARYFIGTTQYQANLGVECNYGGYTTTSIASGNSDSSGHGNFEYSPPSGYYALCTKNLAEFG